MSPMLMFASLAITGALVLYTIGVFKERADGSLRGPHVVLFWIGLACDTTGTTLMSIMARTSAEAAPAIHGITGLAAILLMGRLARPLCHRHARRHSHDQARHGPRRDREPRGRGHRRRARVPSGQTFLRRTRS